MMYQKNEIQFCPPPLYKCIVVLLAAAALMLTACSGLQEDGGNGNVTITLPNAGGRSISADDIGRLERATASYRVHMNDRVLEGTGGNFSAYFAVGLKVDIYVECLNSSRDVIVRTGVKSIVVGSGQNSVDINLKTDGNEIIPPAPQPVPNQVTYDWGEASRHGTKGVLPSPVAVVAGGVFTVDDGTNMTWQHATQPAGFTGWSASPAIEPANGGQATNAPIPGDDYKMPDGGVVLTAQWNKRQYQIRYYENAPSNSVGGATITWGADNPTTNPTNVTALDSASVFSGQDPTSSQFDSKNWTFTGWNTQADGGGTTYSAGQQIQMMTDNIDLYARWTSANVYTVTYNMGSGPSSADSGWRDNDKYTVGTSPAITLPTLTATGYDFMGWQIDGESNNRGGGTSYAPNASVTATAQWNIKTYNITYSMNAPAGATGTSGTVSPTQREYMAEFTLATNFFVVPGYNFDGWYRNDGYEEKVGNSGDTVNSQTFMYVASDMALYAKWNAAQYNVTYNIDGGNGSAPTTQKVTYGQAFTPATYNGTKTGYTFSGWKVGQNGGVTFTAGQSTSDTSIINTTSAITLYAVWTPIQYNITYSNTNGDTGSANTTGATTSFNIETQTITFASEGTLEKIAYAFDGWETTNGTPVSGKNASELIALITSGNTLALQVKWIDGKRTVVYNTGLLVLNELPENRKADATLAVYAAMKDDGSNYRFNTWDGKPWNAVKDSITSVEIGSLMQPTSTANWFYSLGNCTSINLTNLDTSRVTTMEDMFRACSKLTTLDLSMFDTSNVTTMFEMFCYCSALTTVRFGSSFNTSKVTGMTGMFDGCVALTSLDVTNFNTSRVTSFYRMFMTCRALTTLDISSFDTSKATSTQSMFEGCSGLTTIYASSSFQTDNVTSSNNMFGECDLLVGGQGTAFDANNPTDKTYACIDGGTSSPGYFRQKP